MKDTQVSIAGAPMRYVADLSDGEIIKCLDLLTGVNGKDFGAINGECAHCFRERLLIEQVARSLPQ